MNEPQLSPLLREFLLYTIHNRRIGKGQFLAVEHVKEELDICRETTEMRHDTTWKLDELDQIEAELTALHLTDDTPLSQLM